MDDRTEIRRDDDGELCGFVERDGDDWFAMSVFGGRLASFTTRVAAEAHVIERGLASLAEHWHYRASPDDDWQIVCIIEARPSAVRIALDYYSMPGVPTVTLGPDDFAAGAELVLEPESTTLA